MLNLQQISEETLRKAAQVFLTGVGEGGIRKAIDVATGLVGFNLKQPAEQLVPLLSPFQQSIPRLVKPGANSNNWRQITALGSPDPFTTERAAGLKFATTLVSKVATFKPMEILGDVTREAVAASQGFDPALAKETANQLLVAMKLEGQSFIGANITDLGAPANVVVAERSGLGSLAANTYYISIRALTLLALNRITIDSVSDYDGTDHFVNSRSVTIVNPLVDNAGATITVGSGISTSSTEANSGAIAGGNDAIKVTWDPVVGAAGYVIFMGTATGAANRKASLVVGQITSVTIKTLVTTGLADNSATLPAADETGNANHYDGILAQLFAAGSGAYLKNLGAKLSGTAATGEVVELQDAFATIYGTAKIGKFRVICSGTESRILTKLGVVSNAMQIFATPGPEGRLNLTAGAHIGQIVNATTGDVCPVEVEPWLPHGQLLILPTEIPYPMANVAAPFIWCGSFDWEQWPYSSTILTGPVYQFGIRNAGALEGHFTGGCGIIYNIFKG